MKSVTSKRRPNAAGFIIRAFVAAVLATLLPAAATQGQTEKVTDGTTPSGLASGSPAGSYALSGFESVNPYNGGLNFSLPLLTVAGRGGAGYAITLRIDQKWIIRKQFGDNEGDKRLQYIPTPLWVDEFGVMEQTYSVGQMTSRQTGSRNFVIVPGSNCGQVRQYTLTRLTFTAPDGTEYELRDTAQGGQPHLTNATTCHSATFNNRGKVFVTADGTSATFIADHDVTDYPYNNPGESAPAGYMILKDGTRFRVGVQNGPPGATAWMRDPNGNLVTFGYGYDNGGLKLTSVTDALGRVVTISNSQPTVLTYKGFGGADRTVKVFITSLGTATLRPDFSLRTVDSLFPGLNNPDAGLPSAPQVIHSVVLPDGRSYQFKYNDYAELARVVLPTGGAFEYDYAPGLTDGPASGMFTVNVNERQVYRRVVERRVYPDGGGSDTTAYKVKQVYTRPESSLSNAGYVDVQQCTSASGVGVCDVASTRLSWERHHYDGSPRASYSIQPHQYNPWRDGKEKQTDVYDPQSGALLRKVENRWEQPVNGAVWPITSATAETDPGAKPNNPQVTQTLTSLGDTNQVSRKTFSYDPYGNQADVYEYEFGAAGSGTFGAFLRRAHTDFVTAAAYVGATADPATGAGLRGLPLRSWVSTDEAGAQSNRVSLTEYEYDNYASDSRHAPLVPRPNITWLCPTVDAQNQCVLSGDASLTVRGNLTGVTSYANASAESGPVTVSKQYDVAGNVVKTIDGRGYEAQATYGDFFCNGGAGCDGAYTPNTFAFLTGTTSPAPDVSTLYGHPAGTFGSTQPLTSSTVYDFHTGLAYSTTDANSQTTLFEYESQPNQLDRLKAVLRPDGGRTDFNYGDAAGNLYLQTLADLDGARRTESKQHFDGLGRVYRRATLESHDPAKPWLVTDTELDALGRVRRSSMRYRAAEGAAPFSTDKWSENSYDALGRVLTVKTKPDNAVVRTDHAGSRVLVTDQADRQRIIETDALGRLTEVWEVATGDQSKYPGVESMPAAVTAGLPAASAHGYRTQYFYDVVGNLRRVKQGAQQRFFAYDSLRRLARAKAPEQGAFTPDPVGGDFAALTDSTSGVENGQWSVGYLYDANGNLLKRRDARGTTATYGYDALNRNFAISYTLAGETAATPDVKRYYDNNPASGSNGRGRLWKSESFQTAQTAVDKYDAAGRPKQQTQKFWVGGNWEQARAYTTTLSYNLAGGVTSVVYPSGNGVAYNYDAAGRLGDDGAQPAFKGTLGDRAERVYASRVSYDEMGGMREEKFGTQVPLYHKLHYNVRGQLYDVRLSTASWADDQWEWNRGAVVNYYDRDCQWKASDVYNNGNLLCSEYAVPLDPAASYTPGAVGAFATSFQTYSYDALNRLEGVTEKQYTTGGSLTPAFTQGYRYDRWGNRTVDAAATQVYGPNPVYSIPEPQFNVDAQTNRLGAPSGQLGQMAYDPAGNLTTDTYQGGEGGGGSRAYDAEGRMTSAQFLAGQTQTAAYTYDADGRRVKRKAGVAAEVWQVYGTGGELLAEYASGASHLHPLKEYGYRGGELLVTADAPAPRMNFALASAGATATAQNHTQDGVFPGLRFQPVYANDGVRHATTQGDHYWRDEHGLPTWVQVDFAGPRTIGEVDVYTLADYPAYETQADPTATQTFTQYGVTSFDVQYWTGSAWATVPGGSVSGNNLLWRKVTFPALTTDKIRVRVNSAADGVARVTEVEAWEASRANFALASRGGQATASSTTPDTEFPGMTFPVTGVNDGDRKGLDWEHGGGWRDGTNNSYPDWAQVEFAGETTIDEIDVFTLQDALNSPSEPTEAMTFTQYGVTAFDVQYWTGSAWATVPGGSVTGNNKVWRKFTFPAVVTSKVRVLIHGALAGRSRLVEVEAWGTTGAAVTAAEVRWLVSDHLGTPRMVVDQTGSLSGVTRHDYLPFGEQIGADVGGRTTDQGYSRSDGVRQKFTGKEHDDETKLNYFLARYYSSRQGRFISPDPLSDSTHPNIPQGWNSYSYVLNNPLKLVDPDGMMWIYRYLDKEKKRIGIAWIDGDKVPKSLSARGYRELYFGGQSSMVVTATDGSVLRLSANSRFYQQLSGPQQSSNSGAYVNTGLVRELGRRTAPMPAFTAAFILVSANGGYLIAGSSIAALDAAAYALYSVSEMGKDGAQGGDTPVLGTTSSQYEDITKGGSVRNVQTDVSKADFIKTMQASGYQVTRSGNAVILDNGVNRYTVYDVAKSTGGPTAVRSVGGQQSLKIRLKP